MKPTPQISHNQHAGFPLTDYTFQATDDAKSSCAAILPEKKLRAPWKLSAEFFGAEAFRDFVAEFLFFTLMAGFSAWPIISMLDAITRMVRKY